MYSKKILNTILNGDSSIFQSFSGKERVIFLDDSDYSLYSFLYSYFLKYNKVPNREYLVEFFNLEKGNLASKSFSCLGDSVGVSDDLSALVTTQLHYNLKQKILKLQDSYGLKLKLANTSDIKKLTYEYHSAVSELSQYFEDASHKRGLLYGKDIGDRFIKEYLKRKELGKGYYRGRLGFHGLDNVIGGIHSTDKITIMGFVNQGKSPFIRQIAYNLILQSLNVVFVSLEMSYDSIETSFYVLHANNVKIFGFSNPKVTLKKVKESILSDEEFSFLRDKVIEDFNNNEGYGSLYIFQPEDEFTLDDLIMEVNRINQSVMPVDILCIDYAIPLLKPQKGKRLFDNNDYNSVHRRLKLFGLSFDNGRGLPIIDCCQANRSGFMDAVAPKNKEHYYNLSAIGEFNAIEKDSTHIFSILRTQDMVADRVAQIQHLKSRESRLCDLQRFHFDTDVCWFRETINEDLSEEDIEGLILELEI